MPAKNNVAIEATSLVPLYRASGNLPKEAADKMKELTREYCKVVIEDEWKTQAATGSPSSQARRQTGNMIRAFGDGTIIAPELKHDFPMSCNAVAAMPVGRDQTPVSKRNQQASRHFAGDVGGDR